MGLVARLAKMKLLFLAWLHLSGPGVLAQCDAELPSHNPCAQEDFFVEADPDACSFFYECSEGCVSHKQCQPHEDGLPRVFDDVFEWCGLTDEVDCGTRPCKDPIECATQVTRTTATTTEDCGHPFDCSGNGFFPDPFNCRKYWQCYGGGHGEHFLCPDDPATGEPEVFDLVFDGCNYQALTDCGDRPICGVCDEDCEPGKTTPASCSDKPPLDCSELADGYYPDEYNCRKYWHCAGGHGQHMMCAKDQNQGNGPEDLQYNVEGVMCDWDLRVDCGDRLVCDDCDENCVPDKNKNCDADCGPDNHHPADICKGREPGYYPDLFNCAKYWHCDSSGSQHFFCADGLVYEATKVMCDFPERVNCRACGPLGSCNRPTCDCCDDNCHF